MHSSVNALLLTLTEALLVCSSIAQPTSYSVSRDSLSQCDGVKQQELLEDVYSMLARLMTQSSAAVGIEGSLLGLSVQSEISGLKLLLVQQKNGTEQLVRKLIEQHQTTSEQQKKQLVQQHKKEIQ